MALLRPGRWGSRPQSGCLQHRTEAQRRPKGSGCGGTPALPGDPGPGGSLQSETTDYCGLSRARTLSGEAGWRQNILFILSIHVNQGSTHARRRDPTPGTSSLDLPVPGCPLWITSVSFVDIFFPLVSFFVALHGPLSSLFQPLGVPSRTPFPTLGGSLSSLLQPLSGPSPFLVALRGYLFAFSWKSFSPFPTFGGSLSSLLQPLSGPSPFLVALRGYLFAFSWKSFLPFPTFGGSLLSVLQPLSGPSWSFVPLGG